MFVVLSNFIILSNFWHVLTPCFLFTFYVTYAPYKCTYCTNYKHNSLSCLIVRTFSAPIFLSILPGVFGHRANLIWGDRGGFLEEQPVTFKFQRRASVRQFAYSCMMLQLSYRHGVPPLNRPVLDAEKEFARQGWRGCKVQLITET